MKNLVDSSDQINILVVENKDITLKFLKKILPGSHYHLEKAKDHNEAVNKLSKGEYRIIITESEFPGIKGIELIKRIKDTNSEHCILVSSSFPTIKEALESLKAGAYDFIPTPFDEEATKIILNKAIERQKLFKERDKYKDLSNKDGLTELFNHRHFHELLEKEIKRSKRFAHRFSLLMIDIDNFKNINDTLGHFEGDRILRNISKFFSQSVRDIDQVCRYGGEEFTIILPETDKNGALILAHRLRLMVPVTINKSNLSYNNIETTISIGLSCYPVDAQMKDELIKSSDLALYQAKHLGKNRVCSFIPDLINKK
ncbi:MAG: diguanylate cyclase [bacterium]|nr:diguanylate cyclase [bacterium]